MNFAQAIEAVLQGKMVRPVVNPGWGIFTSPHGRLYLTVNKEIGYCSCEGYSQCLKSRSILNDSSFDQLMREEWMIFIPPNPNQEKIKELREQAEKLLTQAQELEKLICQTN